MKCNVCPDAIARIRGGSEFPQVCGAVRFYQRSSGVIVEARICGLPMSETGFFGFHIHEGGNCDGVGFPETGGHFNPGIMAHPNHAGDLPPLLADHGKAYMKVFTGRFRVKDVIGRTVIVHSGSDDFHTQPSGNAGIKIACGVIQKT